MPDPRLDRVIEAQGEIKGQFAQALAEQAELRRTLSAQVDALNQRVSASLADSATKTAATISSIGERLSVIDEAQKNIAGLSTQVMSLQEILSDKQTRGAFGQERMEAIVADQLAPDALRIPGDALQRQPARLHHPGAERERRHRRRFKISAGSV